MLKKSLCFISIILLALNLSACTNHKNKKEQIEQPYNKTPGFHRSNSMEKLGIRFIQTGDNIRIYIPSDNIFEVNSAEILPAAHASLDKLASKLNSYGCTHMNVSAFTDDIGGGPNSYWLAEKQARNLIAYLWTRGVNHVLLTPIAAGNNESQTVTSNRTLTGSALNRRIEISFRIDS